MVENRVIANLFAAISATTQCTMHIVDVIDVIVYERLLVRLCGCRTPWIAQSERWPRPKLRERRAAACLWCAQRGGRGTVPL